MKRYKSLLWLTLALLVVSCSDSFFDLNPGSKVPTDNLYKTASDFEVAVMGCYAKLQSQVSFYTECCEYRSDNLYLSAPTAGTQDRYDIDQFADKPSNGILEDSWANFNNGVYRCNLILNKIDDATFDDALRLQYKGEALFIRAFTYFNMYRTWGGVPVTDKPVTVSEALVIPRSTDDQMLAFIAGDLKQILAEDMLPASYEGKDIGRITSGAARALLGKVYLTFHKWTEARDVLAPLIGKYTLLADPAAVFDVNNKMNNEILFAVRFNKEVEKEGHGYWFSIINLTDNSNQSAALVNCFTESGDKRKDLITYVQVESNVCLMNKFVDTKSATYNVVGNDQIILRYADVLLMYAEALNEVAYSNSQTSDALSALNAVRTRAGLNDIQISTLPDKDSFRKAILLERQREFPYEGHRWFDLVRMGAAKEAMKAEGHIIQDYQLLFPIPQTALERVSNTDILWQNFGY